MRFVVVCGAGARVGFVGWSRCFRCGSGCSVYMFFLFLFLDIICFFLFRFFNSYFLEFFVLNYNVRVFYFFLWYGVFSCFIEGGMFKLLYYWFLFIDGEDEKFSLFSRFGFISIFVFMGFSSFSLVFEIFIILVVERWDFLIFFFE